LSAVLLRHHGERDREGRAEGVPRLRPRRHVALALGHGRDGALDLPSRVAEVLRDHRVHAARGPAAKRLLSAHPSNDFHGLRGSFHGYMEHVAGQATGSWHEVMRGPAGSADQVLKVSQPRSPGALRGSA